jgi:AcrR family transcriptional regulator
MSQEKTVSRKKTQLLESAGKLFMRYGVKRVSVEEICREAQVSKMTFYRYFKDKIDIAGSMLSGMMGQAVREYRAIMDSDVAYPEKVARIITFKLKKSENMSGDFVNDVLSSPYPELRRLMEEWKARTLEMLREDLVQAQREGHIRRDVKPEFLIFLIDRMRAWAMDSSLSVLYPTTRELTREMVNLFYFGVLPSGEKN